MERKIYKNLKCDHPGCTNKADWIWKATEVEGEEVLGFCNRHKNIYKDDVDESAFRKNN